MNNQLNQNRSFAMFASVSVAWISIAISPLSGADEQNPAPPPNAPDRQPVAMDGTVDLYLMNPDGAVDGLLLDNNTVVRFPPHLSEQLTATVNLHDAVKVQGFSESLNTVHAWTITNLRSQRSVTDTPPAPAQMPLPASVPRQQMSASGTIRVVTHAPLGEPDGAVLNDGTTVHIPPAAGQGYTSLLQPGQPLAATGFGTTNSYARSLEAMAIGPAMNQLQNIAVPVNPAVRRDRP
jgi:hypothetical protein